MELNQMNKIIPLSQFDLASLIEATVAYLNKRVTEGTDPLSGIPIVEANGQVPGWAEAQPGRNLLAELTQQGKTLFIPFSDSNTGGPIYCADGQYYEFEEPDEDGCEDLTELEESDLDTMEADVYMGEADGAGFIVSLDAAQNLHIQNGMLFGGDCMCQPSVEMAGVPLIFVDGMKSFIARFEKKRKLS